MAMERRPLLALVVGGIVLVLLVVLLSVLLTVLPAGDGLKCFQCEDPKTVHSDRPRLEAMGGGVVPLCSDFDAASDKFKQECSAGANARCAKTSWHGGMSRSCAGSDLAEGCTVENGITFCGCSGDYCNAAGLTSPALLLLLPAALLAALHIVM